MSTITKSAKTVEGYIEKMILPSDPLQPMWNRENQIYRKAAKWNYIDSCMIRAVLMLYEVSGDRRLSEYADRFLSAYVTESGEIPTMSVQDHNLDNICGGRSLLSMWRLTGESRYLAAAERLRECLRVQPRLKCGNFWHKGIYPGQIWLDSVYMSLPFLAESGGNAEAEDVQRQLENIRRLMRDDATGLYYHGYDETHTMIWADRVTGLSPEFWLRSMGWLSAGLADICELLPECTAAAAMLRELLEALSRFTSEGMLYQLPARRGYSGNYPETSGTLLYAYSAMKARRLGIAGDEIYRSGVEAFSAVTDRFIDTDADGLPVLRNICLMGGLGGDSGRDGTAGYYLREKVVENDAKGIAPYIMAYTEHKKCGQKSAQA